MLRRFRVVFNAVKTHFRQVEAHAGVAGAQVWALHVIQQQPGIGVGGLARAMDIHQSTASNLLKPLLEKGMVGADREGADRRTVHLRISARGRAVLKNAPGPFTGVMPEALKKMDAATLARLDRDLSTLCQLLGVTARGGTLPLGHPDGETQEARTPPRASAPRKTAGTPKTAAAARQRTAAKARAATSAKPRSAPRSAARSARKH